MSKVIGIMSFKGGVGKSVCAINLASGLQRLGKRVLVVDGNFLSPNLHLYLGLLNPGKTLKEIIREGISPQNAIYTHKSGIHLLPCNFYKDVNFGKFRDIINGLRERYDFIIVDSGPSYSEEVIAVLMVSDELLFVATPDYPTLAATVRASKFAKFKDVKVRGIVVNRKRGRGFEVKKLEIERTVGVRVISEIKEDLKMMKAVKLFVPVVWEYKWSSSGRSFMKLAREINS